MQGKAIFRQVGSWPWRDCETATKQNTLLQIQLSADLRSAAAFISRYLPCLRLYGNEHPMINFVGR